MMPVREERTRAKVALEVADIDGIIPHNCRVEADRQRARS
jgi:hypothetical protein